MYRPLARVTVDFDAYDALELLVNKHKLPSAMEETRPLRTLRSDQVSRYMSNWHKLVQLVGSWDLSAEYLLEPVDSRFKNLPGCGANLGSECVYKFLESGGNPSMAPKAIVKWSQVEGLVKGTELRFDARNLAYGSIRS